MVSVLGQQLRERAKTKILAANKDWPTFDKMIIQESGWEHYDSKGNVKMSYTGSSAGVGQLNKSYHPEDIWRDPTKNIDAAVDIYLANLKKFGTYRKAVAAYNWGGANVSGYTNAEGTHPAWDGTREWVCPVGGRYCATEQRNHYLDKILGPGWPEPSTASQEYVPMDQFSVGQGIRDLMASYGDSPATDEIYYKNSAGVNQYSEAIGQSGSRYVYVFSTNKNYRFLAD